jgi:hypothetical protein
MFPRIFLVCFGAALLAAGCIGVSAKPAAGPGGATADPEVKSCRAGTRPADDGTIDDFEDGNTALANMGGRDGYWYSEKDTKGSTINPDPFAPSEGGADGSGMAMHIFGETAKGSPADGAWGAGFGLKFISQDGSTYDASKYAGISFKARVDEKGARRVRLKVGDVKTHPDGQICKTCYNHFGKDFTFTPKWKEYTLLFGEARQEEGWGDPRPSSITPGKLIALDFNIGPGQPYDLWIDDVTFLGCK